MSGAELCLPWKATDDGDDIVIASEREPAEIARIPHAQGAEDIAAFIVRAANEHIGLTRALARVENEARAHCTRADAAEKALSALRTAVGDAAKAMSRGSQEALVRVMHATPAESGQRLARAGAYDYAETLMRAALAGCP